MRPAEWIALTPSWLAMLWLAAKAQWFWRTRPDLSFGWVVLLLCGYLFWEAWEKRPAPASKSPWWGALLAAAGAAMLFLMQIYQAALGMNAACVNGVAAGAMLIVCGNLGFVYGWRGLWHFLFPYAFLLVALPMPSFLNGPLVHGLQRWVTTITVEFLNLIGVPAVHSGTLIELPVGAVGVNEACSGIRSLQSTVMATLFIGYVSFRRNWMRLALVLVGMGLAVLGNLIRAVFLSLSAMRGGIKAVNEVHDAAGWSILLFTLIGVALLAWGFGKLEKRYDAAAAGLSKSAEP
ncbi:MAG: exosortase/archaeosortase family protein [Verrucomicrobia bacterium]|nr:exosortase/archaeosortase family protein [Verrucomicrobiota bacterium]